MADITYIPIRQLHPHPDNPRKELGDLSELAASIKENGVYQNLTVIPGHYLGSREYIQKCVDEGGDASAAAAAWTPKALWSSEEYTIIIGHRRTAAAQQAGLYELPCVIVEMDEREQMQTMMIENMQRSDLTVYEQAQGFQMMMDFGQTVEQIANKSGFSQSTVRRRIKLLELNHDSFQKAEKRGATLADFAQLDKIEDLDVRNEVLETIGTQNFNRAMQDALNKQKWNHYRDDRVKELLTFATEVTDTSNGEYSYVTCWASWNMRSESTVSVPEDADKVEYVFKITSSDVSLYKKRDKAAEDEDDAALEAARATSRLACEQFTETTKLMYELRRDFVKELTPAECKKHLPAILVYAMPLLSEYKCADDDENVLSLLGIGLDEQMQEGTELEDALRMFNAYSTEPEKVLLVMAFDAVDDEREGYWETSWDYKTRTNDYIHGDNENLDRTYELLTTLGYEMADDEKALQDGTHQLFAVYGPSSRINTVCDQCKTAHPECDKCCKTCGDHCNAFQLCRGEDAEDV